MRKSGPELDFQWIFTTGEIHWKYLGVGFFNEPRFFWVQTQPPSAQNAPESTFFGWSGAELFRETFWLPQNGQVFCGSQNVPLNN